MEEELIRELKSLVSDSTSSSFSLLTKASQLAEFTNQDHFRLLFSFHLKGINQTQIDQLRPNHADMLLAFSEDRMKSTERVYLLGSIASLENSVNQYEVDINNAIEDLARIKAKEPLHPTTRHHTNKTIAIGVIGLLRTKQSEVNDIIMRIRGRVASFVHQQASKSAISAQKPVEASRNLRVFIGHGNSPIWRDLKDFLQDRLGLNWDEFNREPNAGLATKERLEEMLQIAGFGFLIMTAEDEHKDKTFHARENVIHEIGLFQGRLGFRKAVILLEDGCQEFSNIVGVGQIRFPKGEIRPAFEEIRRVLEREEIIEKVERN